jgi:hypothetical protein
MNQTFLEPYPEQLAEVDTIMAHNEGKDYWKKENLLARAQRKGGVVLCVFSGA